MPDKPASKPSDPPAPTPSTAGPGPQKTPDPAPPPPGPGSAKNLTADEMLTLLMCPTCGGDLVSYEGTGNPHKIGTAWCAACGQRVKVSGAAG